MINLFYKKNGDYFINKIKNNHHFKYSRFNDGELTAIIKNENINYPKFNNINFNNNINVKNKFNCDGHNYFEKMGLELNEVLLSYKKSDNYILQSYDLWYNKYVDIKSKLDVLKIINADLSFMHDDFIRRTHQDNPTFFLNMLEILKNKKMVIVGPHYLKKLSKHFMFKFIEVPLKNCYLEKNYIIDEMKKIRNERDNNFFLLSASMASNIIIDKFDDNKNTYIDWGSVWDTFFDSKTHPYIRKRSTTNNDKYKKIYSKYIIK